MSNKAIFLDRDDTLIEDPGYISDPGQVKLMDGAAEALIELRAMGYKLVIVSNQSTVARGIITEKVLGEIHNRLEQLLAEKHASLDRIYYCPYHPDGVVPKYRKESDLRKPKPGMLQLASRELSLDLDKSWIIGNSNCDVEAGLLAGCRTILIGHASQNVPSEFSEVEPDFKAVNIKEAVNIIKKYNRSFAKPATAAESIPPPKTRSAGEIAEQLEKQQLINPSTVRIASEQTEQLLSNILEQLKNMQRQEMFSEFSIMRLMAGIVQVIVLFCLLISIWFLMNPTRQQNSVLITLGFALVFQVMALTFYMMQKQK